ncbi:MAG: alpha/beta hydrolase [Actinomycetota bacterium]|nr:alpha/beta hydrolase [Actinomycetota bacterium]
MTTQRLNPSGTPVRVGDLVLQTPGFDGIVELHVGGPAAVRGPAVEGEYDDVFAAHLEERAVAELRDMTPVGPKRPDPRTRGEQRLVTVAGPEASEDEEQVATVQNEDGSISWHFPMESRAAAPGARRGGGRRTFEIPLEPLEAPPDAATTRGPIGFLGRKVLKIFGFSIAGEIGEGIVRRWEKSKRPHRVRELLPDNIQTYDVGELATARWSDLTKGPALLFLHGTNSQIHSGYHALPPDDLKLLHERYGGRVIGFDHPTVSFDPIENVNALLEMVPDDARIELDVVCHSRGGLVARELSEKAAADSPLRVRKVLFVAAPNAGTALAHTKHVKSFLDTYTNFMSLLPSVGFVDILETVVNVAKEVALEIHERLKGLQSMNPEGDYLLGRLNDGPKVAATYAAIAADYEPAEGHKFPLWLRDRLFDEVFEENDVKVKNDLVVPTEGVFAANKNENFPITDICSFEAREGMHHSGFFGNRKVLEFVHERLEG